MAEPRIRFKRDDGSVFPEWKEDCIGNMFSVTRGYVLAVQKTRQEQDSEYLYPVYSSQTKNDGRLGYYNEYLYEDAITWTTDGANAGTVKFRKGKFYCTNVCGVLLEDKVKPNLCIVEILNIATIPWVTHNGNPKLMNNVMSEIKIKYPSSFEEQQKIADFLSSVDDVIATSEQEVANLEMQKKVVMKKIFSQEVRFKKEDGSNYPDWEDTIVKEIGVVVTGNTPSTKEEQNYGQDYLWVTPADITKNECVSSTNKKLSEKGWAIARHLPAGAVLVTCIASIGKNSILATKGSCNQQINAIIPNGKMQSRFILEAINYKEHDLQLLGGNGGMKIVSKSLFENFELPYPCPEEQQKIADFLSNFDEAIVSAKKELELWRQLKKGLLQQMFV